MSTLLQRISLAVGGLVLLLALVASAVVVARSIEALDESFDNAERPARVSRALLRLQLAVSDAESAQRGYLLTGDPSYLDPYEDTRRETDSLLAVLDSLVSWNAQQVARMPGLRASVTAKQNEMDEVLALYDRGDPAAALALVDTDRGAVIMASLRAQVRDMLAEAKRVLAYWSEHVVQARRRALLATALTNAALLALLVAFGWWLRRTLHTRERGAAELHRANASLGQALAEREAALANVQAMQGQLVQQEKLAGLGHLTAGVAHELKNPLNFVNNFAQLAGEMSGELQAALDDGDIDEARALLPDLRLNTAKVIEHGRRADEIVRTMLVHARGVSGERQAVGLDGVLAQATEQALGPADVRTVRVERRDDTAGVEVWGVPSALTRLFLNLVDNAVQAVRERAGHSPDGEDYTPTVWIDVSRAVDRMGQRVAVVTVEDNGPGIADASLPRIFEPFYTTKAPGQGTGLGLSLAYDIATGHGGTLAASRSAGGGALVTATLPLDPPLDPPPGAAGAEALDEALGEALG